MATDSNRFVINKGMSNEFIITIKQDDSTLPMVITVADTFTASLYKLDTKVKALSVSKTSTASGQITVYDAANGQIKITLSSAAVSALVSERGDKVDKYYLKPTYRLAIDCVTTNNGSFVAKLNNVYVEE